MTDEEIVEDIAKYVDINLKNVEDIEVRKEWVDSVVYVLGCVVKRLTPLYFKHYNLPGDKKTNGDKFSNMLNPIWKVFDEKHNYSIPDVYPIHEDMMRFCNFGASYHTAPIRRR
jgi:hypothetical protein